MDLERLPSDGAAWECCFATLIEEHWRCNKPAAGAVPTEVFDRLELPKLVMMHGRAVCETHSKTLEGYLPA